MMSYCIFIAVIGMQRIIYRPLLEINFPLSPLARVKFTVYGFEMTTFLELAVYMHTLVFFDCIPAALFV